LCLWAASHSKYDEWRAFAAFLLAGTFLYLLARLGRRSAA